MSLVSFIAASRRRFDLDAQIWYDAVVTAGGGGEWGSSSASRATNKAALNTLVVALKSAGLWTGFKMRVLAGTNTIAGGLAAGVGGTVTNNNFVVGDINPLTGWIGDGSTKFLATNWAGDATGQNNASLFVWVSSIPSNLLNQAYAGNSTGGVAGCQGIVATSGTIMNVRMKNALNGAPTGGSATALKLFGISRQNSSDFLFRHAGSNQTVVIASDGNLNTSMSFFCRGGSNLFTSARMSVIFSGPGISASQIDSLESILQTYHNNITA
jgi:hypothetical protein